jgi:ribosomal protein S18 acetylase RimI-like enzyme
MEEPGLRIIPYRPEYETAVIRLWRDCGLTRPWNDPARDIERKAAFDQGLFLVGLEGGRVIAAVMGGYDGHRGWIYYLGVHPDFRRRGCARLMVNAVTERLKALACPKINLMIRKGNTDAIGFYSRIGYADDPVITMSKRLVEDG